MMVNQQNTFHFKVESVWKHFIGIWWLINVYIGRVPIIPIQLFEAKGSPNMHQKVMDSFISSSIQAVCLCQQVLFQKRNTCPIAYTE